MAIRLFRINSRSINPWGDYGDILQNGMTMHSARVGGMLALERTGPFIPPIRLPGIDVILTTEARAQLEASGLTGFSFAPVFKKLIVELHWEDWDLNSDKPAEYPDSGEPEGYILGKPHSEGAADALGNLWELVVPVTIDIVRPTPIVQSFEELRSDTNRWNGSDLIRGNGFGGILFSERARDWFVGWWGEYVYFDTFRVAE